MHSGDELTMNPHQHTLRRSTTLLVVTLVAWAVAPAAASIRAAINLDASLDEGGLESMLHASFGERFGIVEVDVDTLLGAGIGAWDVVPTADTCTGSSRPLTELEDALADAEAAVQMLDYAAATAKLAAVEALLCTSTEPVPVETLARIPFLQGVVAFYAQGPEAARLPFRRAAEILPGMEWDTAYPPDPQQVFLLGAGDALHSPRGSIDLDPTIHPATIFVDGREIPSGEATLDLPVGQHLIQLAPVGGELAGALIVLHDGGHALVQARETTLARIAADREANSDVYAMLASAAVAGGYGEMVVMRDIGAGTVEWFNAIDGEWKTVSLAAGQQLRAASREMGLGGAMAAAGAGVLIAGVAINAAHRGAAADLEAQVGGSWGMYEQLAAEHETHRTRAGVGVGLAIGGGALLAAGIPMLIHGAATRKGVPTDARLTLSPITPEGRLGLRIDF